MAEGQLRRAVEAPGSSSNRQPIYAEHRFLRAGDLLGTGPPAVTYSAPPGEADVLGGRAGAVITPDPVPGAGEARRPLVRLADRCMTAIEAALSIHVAGTVRTWCVEGQSKAFCSMLLKAT